MCGVTHLLDRLARSRLVPNPIQMASLREEDGLGVTETTSEAGNVSAMLALSEQVIILPYLLGVTRAVKLQPVG